MARYALGGPVRVSTSVRDVTGTLVTPTTITLTVHRPDGTALPDYTSPTADGVGLYHQDVPAADLTVLGHYAYRWTTTGPGAGIGVGNFDIFDPFEVTVLSLQDAKDHLNIAAATTTYDTEIASKVATIQAGLEKMTGGPIITRTVTERVRVSGDWTALPLRQRPLVAVTSITDVASGTALGVTDLDLDTNAGIVRRKLELPFLGSGAFFTVVYTAGWGTAVPPAMNEAGRIILEHLWQTQHGPSLRPLLGGEEEVTLPGWGFAIPNRAAELLSPYALEAYV